jgi:putative selenate reductase
MTTTLLKPGGYERLKPLAELAEQVMADRKQGGGNTGLDLEALAALAEAVPSMARYRKDSGKSGKAGKAGKEEAPGRRRACAESCTICVSVCPNRANMPILVEAAGAGAQAARQVAHLDRFCNECGNCASFCPRGGEPYRDKYTVFTREDDFADSGNPGFLPLGADRFRLRLEDGSVIDWQTGGAPHGYEGLIRAVMEDYRYVL